MGVRLHKSEFGELGVGALKDHSEAKGWCHGRLKGLMIKHLLLKSGTALLLVFYSLGRLCLSP